MINSTKQNSDFGPVLNHSNLTYNLSGGASITDGGAIMAMFNLASKAIESTTKTAIIQDAQEKAENGTVGETADEVIAAVKDFFKENKTVLIVGGLVIGYLIYKGVTK